MQSPNTNDACPRSLSRSEFEALDAWTGYQGTITAGYRRIEKLLGTPVVQTEPSEYSITWYLMFDDLIPGSIYLRIGTPAIVCPERLVRAVRWHIGGQSREVVDRVSQCFRCRRVTYLSDEIRELPQDRHPDHNIVPF